MIVQAVVARIAEQIVEGAAQLGQRTGHGQVQPLRAREAVGVQVDQPAAARLAGFGERVVQRRARIANLLVESHSSVNVTERRVVNAAERRHRDLVESAQDVALAVVNRVFGALHERVGQHHRSSVTRGRIGPDEVHRMPQRVRLGSHGFGIGPLGTHLGRIEERDGVEVHRSVVVGDRDRLGDLLGLGLHEHTGSGCESCLRSQTRGGVMVAAGGDHPGSGFS